MTTTWSWSPNSFQLRLATFVNCRSRNPSVVLVRTRIHKLDRRFRLYTVAEISSVNNNKIVSGRSENTWTVNNFNSLADGFAGWNADEQSGELPPKQSLKGILGAGIAGVVLVAGLTFAALAIGKRSSSKQQMVPLTTQQECLISNDHNNRVGENKHENEDGSVEQSTTGIDMDLYSSQESKHNESTDVDDAPREASVTNNAPTLQDFENEPTTSQNSVDPEVVPKPPDGQISSASNSISEDAFIPSEKAEPFSEPEGEKLITNSSLFNDHEMDLNNDEQEELSGLKETVNPNSSFDMSQGQPTTLSISASSQSEAVLEPNVINYMPIETTSTSSAENFDIDKTQEVSAKGDESPMEIHSIIRTKPPGTTMTSDVSRTSANEELGNVYENTNESRSQLHSNSPESVFTSVGIPAPSVVSAALQATPGKVLVPAIIDQAQAQTLAALQALKVIEADVQPGDLCTRREYARWLVSTSSALSRSTVSKVYPAMYIENFTELAFDDITAEDPDFPSIQGLAEAGLISSKLSRRDMQPSLGDDTGPLCFSPESPLSRQDLLSWKMALEKKQLPMVDRKSALQVSGFIDIDKINPDAWPALVADIGAGEQGIIALAFGYTRLFQPDKPVTKAQAAIALATGEASDIVGEELTRIEAESMAESVVAAHNALVAQVEEDVNATYEKELQLEREKIDAVEKMAEATREELDRMRADREAENLALLKERAAVDSEMEVFSRLRRNVEEELHTLMSNNVEISHEKERLSKLRKDAEFENQEIARLQYELEVERKALSMARSWAEEEAKRAKEQAKALEEARERWSKQGIKVVVDDDLLEEENDSATWAGVANEFSVEGTVDRAENLVDRLKSMADNVGGKSKDTINKIIQKILHLIEMLKEWTLKVSQQAGELKDGAVSRMDRSFHEVQRGSVEFTSTVKGGVKRIAEDCRGGVEKLTQKFKT